MGEWAPLPVAKALKDGTIDGNHLDVVGDLEGWFGHRGVRGSLFVRGRRRPGASALPSPLGTGTVPAPRQSSLFQRLGAVRILP